MRHAVEDRVVHGRAEVVAERAVAEGRCIVHVAGDGAGGVDELGGAGVEVQQGHAGGGELAELGEDVPDEGAGGAGAHQLGGGEDLDHGVPSGVWDKYPGQSIPVLLSVHGSPPPHP